MKTIFAMAALAAFFVTPALANGCLKYTYRGAIHCVQADGTLDQIDLAAAEAEPSTIETFVRNNDTYIEKIIFGGVLAICLLISRRFLSNPILRRTQARAIRRKQLGQCPWLRRRHCRRQTSRGHATNVGQMLAHPEYYCEGGTLSTETFKCEK